MKLKRCIPWLLLGISGATGPLLAQAATAPAPIPAPVPEPEAPAWLWIVFTAIVTIVMALDVFLFNRTAHKKTIREAITWVVVCILIALLFNVAVFLVCGNKAGVEFLTGYLIELNLSVDNLFVFLVIFGLFGVTADLQPRVLAWGIFGAIFLRLLFIYAGIALVEKFGVLFHLFGAILIYTGIKLLSHGETKFDPEKQWVVRLARRFLPISPGFHGQNFFVRGTAEESPALKPGKLYATPLFLVLLVIESTDVVFAVDSVPAIIGITTNRFVAFTSNVFAILGLRAMFFVLTAFLDKFHYLKLGLSFVLIFIGTKMIVEKLGWVHIEQPWIPLLVVVGMLGTAIAASLLFPPKAKPLPPEEDTGEIGKP